MKINIGNPFSFFSEISGEYSEKKSHSVTCHNKPLANFRREALSYDKLLAILDIDATWQCRCFCSYLLSFEIIDGRLRLCVRDMRPLNARSLSSEFIE